MNVSKEINMPALGSPRFESYGISDSATDKAAAEFLADELERLMSSPLDTLEQAKRWDTDCADVMTVLETRFPRFEIEHHVWHFFADADIRRRDPGYRRQQHQAIADYVTRLRNGNLRKPIYQFGAQTGFVPAHMRNAAG